MFFQRITFDFSHLVVGSGNTVVLERAIAELANHFSTKWVCSPSLLLFFGKVLRGLGCVSRGYRELKKPCTQHLPGRVLAKLAGSACYIPPTRLFMHEVLYMHASTFVSACIPCTSVKILLLLPLHHPIHATGGRCPTATSASGWPCWCPSWTTACMTSSSGTRRVRAPVLVLCHTIDDCHVIGWVWSL